MKIELESTTKVIDLVYDNDVDGYSLTVPARIWEGKTENGISVHAFITRIAVHKDEDQEPFKRELESHKEPSFIIEQYPLRLIL